MRISPVQIEVGKYAKSRAEAGIEFPTIGGRGRARHRLYAFYNERQKMCNRFFVTIVIK
jgi:hypothetical protein